MSPQAFDKRKTRREHMKDFGGSIQWHNHQRLVGEADGGGWWGRLAGENGWRGWLGRVGSPGTSVCRAMSSKVQGFELLGLLLQSSQQTKTAARGKRV